MDEPDNDEVRDLRVFMKVHEKKRGKDEENIIPTLREFVYTSIKETFSENLPIKDIKDLPSRCKT